MADLSEIVFESLNDSYARGRYGPFAVILRRADNYVNATKLAALGEKRFDHWLANKGSKELIAAVAARLAAPPGNPGDALGRQAAPTATVTGGATPEVRGTYVHPLLVPHIASWVSTEFAIKASEILNAAMVREYREALRAKDDKIDRLEAMVVRLQATAENTGNRVDGLVSEVGGLRKQNDTLVSEVGGLISEVRVVREQNETLVETTTQVLSSVNEMQDLALAASKDAVVRPEDSRKEERFALLAVTDELNRRRLYVVRCQARTLTAQVSSRRRQAQAEARARAQRAAQQRDLDENMGRRLQELAASRVRVETVFALSCVPNARHLWNCIQEEAGEKIRVQPGAPTSIELIGMTESEFEELARRLREEPQSGCRAAAETVQKTAEQTVQVAVGQINMVNNLQLVVVAPARPKISDADLDDLLSGVL